MTKPTRIEEIVKAFATSEHIDNDLGIKTRYPNQRFTFLAGFKAALSSVSDVRDAAYVLTTVALHDTKPYQKQIKHAQDAIRAFDALLAEVEK